MKYSISGGSCGQWHIASPSGVVPILSACMSQNPNILTLQLTNLQGFSSYTAFPVISNCNKTMSVVTKNTRAVIAIICFISLARMRFCKS